MEPRLLGYQNAVGRMQELKSRIEELTTRHDESDTSTPPNEFSNLMGKIGGNASLKPLNPFGPGVKVDGLSSPNDLKPMIDQAAARAGIDPGLLDALVATESGYNPNARSSAGAMGLTQLMPGTAKSLGVTDPFNAQQNLMGGANYLAKMIDKYGDVRLALAAYNAGPGAVDRHGGLPPYKETQNYVQKVLATYEAKRSA
ncbi:MAG: lytic transglycosylase domain-containing protein [Fimbriimonadaceae bacterium]|nr:lytic transglycosylase domain-containing protein [Fimbriimonadaceae bacterium]